MEKLILLIIGILCIWYFYKKFFKSSGCHCDGCCSCNSINDDKGINKK